MNANEIIQRIAASRTPDEVRAAHSQLTAFTATASPEDTQRVREAWRQYVDDRIQQIDEQADATRRFLALSGKEYDLNDWLTVTEYARRYGLGSPNVVSNWISRGVIPPADILEVAEFNNLRLVRNRPYKDHQPV